MRRTSTNSLLVIALAISAGIAFWGLVDPAGLDLFSPHSDLPLLRS